MVKVYKLPDYSKNYDQWPEAILKSDYDTLKAELEEAKASLEFQIQLVKNHEVMQDKAYDLNNLLQLKLEEAREIYEACSSSASIKSYDQHLASITLNQSETQRGEL